MSEVPLYPPRQMLTRSSLPWGCRGAIEKVNFSDFRENTRNKWRIQDVEYGFCTPPHVLDCFLQLLRVKSRVAPRKMVTHLYRTP